MNKRGIKKMIPLDLLVLVFFPLVANDTVPRVLDTVAGSVVEKGK